jgi:hypothetical protein
MATTAETESAQALFCALADLLGSSKAKDCLNLEKYPTFYDFTGYTGDNFKAKGYNKALKEDKKEAKTEEKKRLDKEKVPKNLQTQMLKDFEKNFEKEFKDKVKKKLKEKPWKKNNEYLKEAFLRRNTKTNVKNLSTLKKVLDDELGWYKSSVKIAVKLLADLKLISNKYKIINEGCEMVYYRGGKDNPVMGTIAELFALANKETYKFGDINKWSPADMYFATKTSLHELKNLLKDFQKSGGMTWEDLNDKIVEQINLGQLLPLSLKKVKDDAHLVKVNWKKGTKTWLMKSVKYNQVQSWNNMPFRIDSKQIYTTRGPDGFKWNTPTTKGVGPVYPRSHKVGDETIAYRDIYLDFTIKEKWVGDTRAQERNATLQFRHTPAPGGVPSGTIKTILGYQGLNAISAGQVASIDWLFKLITRGDKDFAAELKEVYDTGFAKFKAVANAYLEAEGNQLYDPGLKYPLYWSDHDLVKWGSFDSKNELTIDQQKIIFNEDMGAISGVTLMNDFRATLDNYFSKPGVVADAKKRNVIMEIFKYTSSRTDQSAAFVIAK